MMTRHAAWHMWRLSEAGDENLGLACSDDGLLIGRTPLIEKRDGHFVVREQREIEQLLSRAYRSEVTADRIMSGLATVARALNANDQCLARIAAFSDIPDFEMRATRWRRRMSSSNTPAMKAPVTKQLESGTASTRRHAAEPRLVRTGRRFQRIIFGADCTK